MLSPRIVLSSYALFVLFAAPAVGEQEESYLLRYHFTPGEVLRWRVTHSFQMDSSIQGESETSEGRSESVKVWEVEQVEGGAARIAFRIGSAKMRQKTDGQPETNYDSTSDDAPPSAFVRFADNIDRVLSRIEIDERGETRNRKDLRPLAQSEGNFDALLIPLPKEPIAVGRRWNVRKTVPAATQQGVKQVRVRRRYVLRKVVNDLAYIDVETDVLSPINDPTAKAQLMQVLGDGEVVFNMDAGRIVRRRLDLDEEIVGFSGHASTMRYRGRFQESLSRVDEQEIAATR